MESREGQTPFTIRGVDGKVRSCHLKDDSVQSMVLLRDGGNLCP